MPGRSSNLFGGRDKHAGQDPGAADGTTPRVGNGAGFRRATAGEGRPTVFLSYAHEGPGHKADVRRLYDLLEADVAPILDQIHELEVDEHDWAKWTRDQVDEADFVLVIASPAYKTRSDTPRDVPNAT